MKRFLPLIALFALSACGTPSRDSSSVGTKTETTVERFEVAMPRGGEVVDAQHGREIWFAIGPVSGMGGIPANGVADAHYFEDGSYLLNIKVNIARPPDGVFYEGWVVRDGDWVSLGHLQSHFGDARHGVQFRQERDLRDYLDVSVTREKDDGNPAPGEVVAEGILKVTPR